MRAIASECGLHEVTARILYARGVDTSDKVRRFLAPSRKHFLSPFLMRGMRELVDRLAAVRRADDWSLYSATMMQTVSAPHPF